MLLIQISLYSSYVKAFFSLEVGCKQIGVALELNDGARGSCQVLGALLETNPGCSQNAIYLFPEVVLIWILLALWPSQCFILVSVAQECSNWAPEYFRNLLLHAVNCSDTYISAAWPVALNLVLYSKLCHFLLNSSQFFLCNFIFGIAICVLPPLQLVSHHPVKCTFLCGCCFRFCSLYLHHPLPALHQLLKPWSSFQSTISCTKPFTILQSMLFSAFLLFVFLSVQLVWVSRSVVSDSETPWTAACQASLSITNSQSPHKLMSIESVMPSNHLILCHPLPLLPSIFPSIRVFSNESALLIRWPKYWSFSFNSSPSSEHSGLISFRMDWLDLLAVQGTLKSLVFL